MNIFSTVFGKPKGESDSFVHRLRALGHDIDSQVNIVLALLVGVTVELSQGACYMCGGLCTMTDREYALQLR